MNVPVPAVPPASRLPAHPGAAAFAARDPQLLEPLGFQVSEEQKLELLEYWRSILKRKWLILGLGLVAAVVAAVVSLAIAPSFQSTATVLIEAGKGKILSFDDIYAGAQQREHYQTQVEILKSREVAERTVRALELWKHPGYDPRKAAPGLRARAAEWLGIGREEHDWTEDELVARAVKQLSEAASVEPVRLSQLVRVRVTDGDPKLAAQLANTLAEQYIQSDRDARFKISQGVSGFLQERLTSLREKLAQSEQALQAYREKRGIVSLGGSAQTMAGQQVGGTSERLLAARARRMELEASYQQVRSQNERDYADVPAIKRDPAVAELSRQLNDVQRRLAEALQTLGTQHPKARQLQTEQGEIVAMLGQQQQAAAAALTREYEAARSTEQSLERALGSARGAVQSVNREEFELAVLERDVATNRQLYDMFMSRAKETNLAGDVQASVARVVDSAVAPDVPIKPRKTQIVGVTLLLALLLGALAAVLVDRLDDSISGDSDAEIRLRQAVLVSLPGVSGVDRRHMARLYLDDTNSHFAEAVRTARTGVMLSNLDVPHKVLLVTSSLPGEGKTTVAVNLALAHAQTKRTLLIDCDMRRSQVSTGLGLPEDAKGLSNLVAGGTPLSECVFGVKDSRLLVLPVGDLPPNPLELLLSQRFKDVLGQLKAQFEMIVIDSPPVELVSEALVLAPLATSTAFVVKADSTSAHLARKSLARLQRAGASILGVVINQVDFKRGRGYYGSYGAPGYAYAYRGYGQLGDDKGGKKGKNGKGGSGGRAGSSAAGARSAGSAAGGMDVVAQGGKPSPKADAQA